MISIRQDPPADGHTNMAADVALLEGAEEGRGEGRVYTWSDVWVTLGRFQSPEKDLLDPQTTNWVIRPTGGKAVLHGHDTTVGLALPLSLLDADPRSIRSVYRAAVGPLVEALNACGLPAVLADGTRYAQRGVKTADCFAFTSPNDIVHRETGQKVCGCALRVTERAVLVHASVPHAAPEIPHAMLIREAMRFEPPTLWQPSFLVEALASALND